MTRSIAYNLVRGITGAMHPTPRGIDRIDLGCGTQLFRHWPGDCFGVMPTPWGIRYFPRDRVLRGCEQLSAFWRENHHDGFAADAAYLRLKAEMGGLRSPALPVQRRASLTGWWRIVRLVLGEGVLLGHAVGALPKGTIYLDLGHYGLTTPWMLRWLDHRRDIQPVFMLHDVIPLELPDHVAAETVNAHRVIMRMAATYASIVLAPSASARVAIAGALAGLGRPDLPIHAVNLPIDDVFRADTPADPDLTARPYFVICGAIEPRKNHNVLISAWEQLVATHGHGSPRLIIAGSPGHASAAIMARIQDNPVLRGHIIIAANLATPSLARLMAGARALLMPSLAEGYGLPPIEALSLGTPAILSDIGAHRDAAGAHGIYLDPLDVASWRTQIEAMTLDTPEYRATKQLAAGFKPADWPDYMDRIQAILAQLE